jgi:uncharacterized protein
MNEFKKAYEESLHITTPEEFLGTKGLVELIFKIAVPDKVIWIAADGSLTRGINNSYLNLLVTLPSATNEKRRCICDKIENVCLDHGFFVSVLVHTSAQFNNMLGQNSYFFYLINKDCLLLYDSGKFPTPDFNLPTSRDLKKQGESFLRRWHGMASIFYRTATYNFGRSEYRMAAFMLHQTLENIYTSIYLVFTGYRPSIHNLAKLRKSTFAFSPLLEKVFSECNAEDMHLFSLVKNAYVSARYFEHFPITKLECQILMSRVKKLLLISQYICKKRIGEFVN